MGCDFSVDNRSQRYNLSEDSWIVRRKGSVLPSRLQRGQLECYRFSVDKPRMLPDAARNGRYSVAASLSLIRPLASPPPQPTINHRR